MSWSRTVATPDEAVAALADPGDALDLRAFPWQGDDGQGGDLRGGDVQGGDVQDGDLWRRLGFVELVPRELVRPVPVVLEDVEQTRALGRRIAAELAAGDLVVLTGPLGAGKTALAQGIGAGLGVQGPVHSPTFVLARVHRGPLPMVHVDAYRLREAGSPALELDDLDLDTELTSAVVVVEWGEGLVEGLADARVDVRLDRPADGPDDLRTALVVPSGARWSLSRS